MVKKLLSMILVLTMLLFVLVGCTAKTADKTAEKEWPKVTLHYLNINSESMGGPQIQALVDKFNTTNGKNITVEFNFISSSYQEIASKVQSYLAAGQDVGVVQVGYSYVNYYSDNFPQMQNIENVISTYFPEDKDFVSNTYNKEILDMGYALNGNLAGLPYGMSTPILYYNADMCKNAGLDVENPPKTWQEVRTWAEAIKKATGNYGVAIQNPGDTYSIIPIFLSSGNNVISNDGKGNYSACFYSDKSVNAWKLLQDMRKDELYVQLTMDEGVASFAGGKLGMFLTTSGRAKYFKSNCQFDIRSTLQPTFEGNTLKVCTGGNVLAIVGKDENTIKASWEFIKYMLQPENIGAECAATGYLPPTKNSKDDPTLKEFLASNKLVDAAVAELPYASQWTSWPGKNGLQIDQHLINMRDSILSNVKDVDTSIKTTQDTINELLAAK